MTMSESSEFRGHRFGLKSTDCRAVLTMIEVTSRCLDGVDFYAMVCLRGVVKFAVEFGWLNLISNKSMTAS